MLLTLDFQNALELETPENSQLPSQQVMQKWLLLALEKAGYSLPSAELTVRVVEPAESQSLNAEYRAKDKPTNVLSFPFEAPPQIPCDFLGDLVICHSIVIDEAQQQGKLLVDHWAHMLIHGCLHLLGFDHIQNDEAEAMEALEIDILQKLQIGNPYQSN